MEDELLKDAQNSQNSGEIPTSGNYLFHLPVQTNAR